MKSIGKERMMNNLFYVLLVFFMVSCSDNGEAKNESTAGNQESDETYSIENLKWIEGFGWIQLRFHSEHQKLVLWRNGNVIQTPLVGKGFLLRKMIQPLHLRFVLEK